MKHNLKEWLGATRYWSFPVSSMPVIVTVAYLCWKGSPVNWTTAVLALLGMVIFHAAGNLLSDWWDYRKGIDNERAYAVPNLVFHHFEALEYLIFSFSLFAAGICLGLVLWLLTGWKVLVIGIVGLALAASYSFFKYRALGDLFVFVCFSVLPMLGTSLVTTGQIDWSTLWVALPLGIFTVAVLHDNNTVDIATDSESGIRTVPMMLGEKSSTILFIIYMALPYLLVLICCAASLLPPLALLSLLSAPLACQNTRAAARWFKEGRSALLGLDQKTAQLHMAFSLLLTIGLTLNAIF